MSQQLLPNCLANQLCFRGPGVTGHASQRGLDFGRQIHGRLLHAIHSTIRRGSRPRLLHAVQSGCSKPETGSKKHGPQVDVRIEGLREEGPDVDGQRQGRWICYGFDEDESRRSLIEIHKNGERIDCWRRQPDPAGCAPSAAAGSSVGSCFTSTLCRKPRTSGFSLIRRSVPLVSENCPVLRCCSALAGSGWLTGEAACRGSTAVRMSVAFPQARASRNRWNRHCHGRMGTRP